MKRKRIVSLLLAAAMALSMISTAMPAYAENTPLDTGLCAHHTAHTKDCGYVEAVTGAPCTHVHDGTCGYQEAVEGKPCSHVCTEETGCVKISCVHIHDESCGYISGDADSCTHVCTEETGCVVTSCIHQHDATCGYVEAVAGSPCTHVHDESCGYVEAVAGHECEFLCPICDCTCSVLCQEDTVDQTCPVCASNWENCSGEEPQLLAEDTLTISWEPEKTYVALGETAKITVAGKFDSTSATSATVSITLSDEEAALLQISDDDSAFRLVDDNQEDGKKSLKFTLTSGQTFQAAIEVKSDVEATLDLDANTDVEVRMDPESAATPSLTLSMGILHFVPAQGTVTVTQTGEVSPVTVGYLDADGAPAAVPDNPPVFTLAYSIDNGSPQELDPDNLPFGMSTVPTITMTKEDKWTASVNDKLPTEIEVADGQGGQQSQTVTWTLMPGNVEGYTLEWLEAGQSGAKTTGWYYILPPTGYEEAGVQVEEKMDTALIKTIYWADNNDAAQLRPEDLSGSYVLQYALDGSDNYTTLHTNNMAYVGLDALPAAVTDDLGGGCWELSVPAGVLPTGITYHNGQGETATHTVAWRLVPTDTVSGYSMVEITAENQGDYPSVGGKFGTYYVLMDTFSFTLKLNRGETTLGQGLAQAFADQFYFTAEYSGGQQYFQLNSIQEHITYSIPDGQDPDHPNSVQITVSNLWRYNVDNSRMLYSIKEGTAAGDAGDGKMDLSSLTDGDYFAISYDNSASPGYGSELTKVRDGGTICLTLTGTVDYIAYKEWLDDGQTTRPTAEMHLWRYRQGENYTTASVVRDSNNQYVTLTLSEATQTEAGNDNKHTVLFTGLAKYDPEGYPYVYVVREYLSGTNAGSYEKVFGKIAESDGNVTITDMVEGKTDTAGTLRDQGNTWLYEDGTLSNRLIGTIPVTVSKTWKAASFQSEFEDVSVQVSLQSRHKDSQDAWEDTGITYELDDFYAENLTDAYTGYYSAYDELGHPLEYRWVETAVYQNGTEVPSTVGSDGTRTFTLSQSAQNVTYVSNTVTGTGADGTNYTYITNTIADTVKYQAIKQWGTGTTPKPCSFTLYQSVGGEQPKKYVSFTIRGETQNETLTAFDSTAVTMVENPAWSVLLSNLPEYDDEGRKYEYMLLEQDGKPLSITTERQGDTYISTVVNTVDGTENNIILVRKAWIDDSDVQHRETVTIVVYSKANNAKIQELTLSEENGWYTLVNIGTFKADQVYILETKVGNTVVEDPENPEEPTDETRVQFSTAEHVYEASYSQSSYDGIDAFTVTNRRLGIVDLTVTKTWADGDTQQRLALRQALEEAGLSLAIRLDFRTSALGYNITRTGFGNDTLGDTVNISQTAVPILNADESPADSIQTLDLAKESQTLYFWNLPKYDTGGAAVRYTVSEIFVDKDGLEVDLSKPEYAPVEAAYRSYRLSFTAGPYIVGERHAHDTQTFYLTNGLSDTKSVSWHCLWLDDYVYQTGNRPDIYLDIYARVHVQNEDGSITTETKLYQAEYKWEYDATNPSSFWTVTLDNLPMYDDLGYEIDYFATVATTVNYEDFSYLPVRYSAGSDSIGSGIFGTKAGLNDPGDATNGDKLQELPGASEVFALESGNTFVFMIDGTLTYAGEKLWTNLPGRYSNEDLPKVTFTLNRRVENGNWENNVASLTVDHEDWVKLKKNNSYVFQLLYEGVNVLDDDGKVIEAGGRTKLPRFNAAGEIYEYELVETIVWEGTDAAEAPDSNVFSTTTQGSTITNNYEVGNAALSVKKILTVSTDQVAGKEIYPAITMVLTRTYTKSDGTVSAPETVKTLVWSAAEVKQAVKDSASTGDTATVMHTFNFEELPVYAPNGARYCYTVTEEKDELGGYDTWAAVGDLTAENVKTTGTETNLISNLSPNTTAGVDATFLNEPGEAPLTITGEKVWEDLNDVFALRPALGGITLTIQKTVGEQTGQGNQAGWVTVSQEDYTVQWSQVDGNANRWKYTITGLPRYAPNGMPYTYRITESADGGSKYYRVVYSSHVQTDNLEDGEGTDAVTVKAFTNTMLTDFSFSKKWTDEDGKSLTASALGSNIQAEVVFQLQVRDSADGSSYGLWQNAADYFADELSEAALTGAGLDALEDSVTIRGTLNAKAWTTGGSFKDLPTAIKDSDENIYILEYRVVETAVKIYLGSNNTPVFVQTFTADETGNYTATEGPFAASGETSGEKTTIVNTLTTTKLSVTKVWEDAGSESSRPGTGGNWSISFLIQRSIDGITWENTDMVQTLTGTRNEGEKTFSLESLPSYGVSAAGFHRCYYRAVELQPDVDLSEPEHIPDASIVKGGEIYDEHYLARYEWEDAAHTQQKVTNSMVSGLTISKTVSGHLNDPDTEFQFKLTLSNQTVNGTYGDVEFVNGIANFSLKDGQSVVVSGLQVASTTTYTVEEVDAKGASATNVKTTVVTDHGNQVQTMPGSRVDGTLGDNAVISVLYTNTFEETVEIPVEKQWQDDDDQAGYRPESITVNLLENGSVTGKSVTLNESNAWKDSFTDLPKYDANNQEISYTVSEQKVDNYSSKIVSDGKGGFILTNTYEPYKLTLSKTVTGSAGDRNQEFSFQITLQDAAGKALTGSIHYTGGTVNGVTGVTPPANGTVTLENGIAEVTLKHGQSITLEHLPEGCQYTISETKQDGYTVTVTVDGGTAQTSDSVSGSLTRKGTTVVEFENNKEHIPVTGIRSDIMPWSLTLGIVLLGGTALGLWRRKKRRSRRRSAGT